MNQKHCDFLGGVHVSCSGEHWLKNPTIHHSPKLFPIEASHLHLKNEHHDFLFPFQLTKYPDFVGILVATNCSLPSTSQPLKQVFSCLGSFLSSHFLVIFRAKINRPNHQTPRSCCRFLSTDWTDRFPCFRGIFSWGIYLWMLMIILCNHRNCKDFSISTLVQKFPSGKKLVFPVFIGTYSPKKMNECPKKTPLGKEISSSNH